MEARKEKTLTLRDGSKVIFIGKGVLGRILVGRNPASGKAISWNLEGRWRWDGQDHSLDIIDSFSITGQA